MSQVSTLLDLFVSFARVTLFGFGGGPSMIPLVRSEVIEVRGWLTPETFLDAFAFGNALPGPIVTKLAMYVGHHVAGWPGAVAALLGATLPTLALMLLVLRIVIRAKNNQALQSAITGIRPIVVALLLLVAWDFAPNALGGVGQFGTNWPRWVIAAVSLYLTVRHDVHPVLLIIAGAGVGIVFGLAA